ncbi:MAG: DNA repair exonuclease [Cyanobacteria bacterium J06639_1]
MPEPKAKFLHVADVHLGFDRYESPERTKDFFYSFQDALLTYGVEKEVDFILIAGDLFEKQNILPNILNQAQLVLNQVKEAGIPVLAIEGNHDNRPYGVNTSWLRYLADYGYLKLLEPQAGESGEFDFIPWSESAKKGAYIDLPCGVRVIGSRWYGSAAPQAIASLADSIRELPSGPETTVMMFHHGLEGQIARYAGALRYDELLPLKQAGVDYLGLGHIHKNYEVEGWIFNPGSLEANSMAEVAYDRGAYYVEISKKGEIEAELIKDYRQRASLRLRCEVKGKDKAEDVAAKILACVEDADIDPDLGIMLEIKVIGKLGFERYEIDARSLRQQIQDMTGALVVLLKIEATSLEYDIAPQASETTDRNDIEKQVFQDLLSQNAHYRRRSEDLSKVLLGVKEMIADGREDEQLYEFLQQGLIDEKKAK